MRPPGLCESTDRGERQIGRVNMGLTVLCELGDGHTAAHQSTFPDGTVWTWGRCLGSRWTNERPEQCALLDGHDGEHLTTAMIRADQERVALEAHEHGVWNAAELAQAGTTRAQSWDHPDPAELRDAASKLAKFACWLWPDDRDECPMTAKQLRDWADKIESRPPAGYVNLREID